MRQFDSALASVVCSLQVGPSGRVTHARLAVGAVQAAPFLVGRAAELLCGLSPADDVTEAVSAVVDEVLPPALGSSHLQRYQRELVPGLVRRAVARAFEQSGS